MPWSPQEPKTSTKPNQSKDSAVSRTHSSSANPDPHPLGVKSFLLPVVSSIDNVVVGMALGLGGRSLDFWATFLIAIVNSLCTMLAGFVGSTSSGTWLAAIIAIAVGVFFLCFGSLEIWSWFIKQESYLYQMAASWWLLAIPLSIDNCLSGTVGGTGEVDVFMLGLATLLIAFLFLWFGLWLGKFFGSNGFPLDGRLLVGFAFIFLGFLQVIPHFYLVLTLGRGHEMTNALLQQSSFRGSLTSSH